MTDLTIEFETLCESTQPNKRGRLFEGLFCRLLYKNGFDVHYNAGSAKPRQTDLLAEHGTNTFLFELKWLKHRVDIDVIGQMRDRLRRVPRGTIGCVCSMSGFTESLIHDIEQYRHEFEVLLFNPVEIYRLFAEQVSILDLIDEKRQSMKRHGTAWFFREGPRSSGARYVELPASSERLESSDKSVHFKLDSPHISDLVFVSVPLLFNEYLGAFSLRVELKHFSTKDCIKDALTAATNYLGIRGGGRFGIRQNQSGWYGLGSGNFLNEIGRYSERYKGYKGRIHHSEELVFFEELNQGLFLLTARQSLTREGMIHSGEIIIRLPGIPADTRPYLKFMQSLGQSNLLFTPEQPLSRSMVRLPPSVEIRRSDVITTIEEVRTSELDSSIVSGLVIKNPFFKKPSRIAKYSKEEELRAFAEPEYLICTLHDWLDVGDEVDAYFMTSLESVTIGEAVLLHPRCTWKNLTKRIDPNEKDGVRKLGSDWERREKLSMKIKAASERQRFQKQ